jgi:hypothetical protein
MKIHTEGFKTTHKGRNFNIPGFYKTEIITSMTMNHTNQIKSGKPKEISQTERYVTNNTLILTK